MGRGQVLELVDQQMPVLGLERTAQRAVAEEGLQGQVDLLVEVDHSTGAQRGTVGDEGIGQTGHVAELRLDLLG